MCKQFGCRCIPHSCHIGIYPIIYIYIYIQYIYICTSYHHHFPIHLHIIHPDPPVAPLRRGGCLGRLHRQRRLPRRQPAWRLGHWLPARCRRRSTRTSTWPRRGKNRWKQRGEATVNCGFTGILTSNNGKIMGI